MLPLGCSLKRSLLFIYCWVVSLGTLRRSWFGFLDFGGLFWHFGSTVETVKTLSNMAIVIL